jgi:flagella basal body P-ring formation protein FlgA
MLTKLQSGRARAKEMFPTAVGGYRLFRRWQYLTALIFLAAAVNSPLQAGETGAFQLNANAQVDGSGVYFAELVRTSQSLPSLRLCDAPEFGKTAELTRAEIINLLSVTAPGVTATNWTGADKVTISRRSRTLTPMDTLALLTSTLQKDFVQDKGELELDFTQPWDPPTVPDEPLTVKILEMPLNGVAPMFIIRFELCTSTEIVGTWQASLQAHVWRTVWAAHSNLQREELISEADIDRERRDVLNIREALAQFSSDDSSLQLAEGVEAGNILLARDLKPRTVIHRGQMADALLQDGALNIMMKVEVMEDGAPGEIVQVRNPVSMRSLSGKVLNDQTVEISL